MKLSWLNITLTYIIQHSMSTGRSCSADTKCHFRVFLECCDPVLCVFNCTACNTKTSTNTRRTNGSDSANTVLKSWWKKFLQNQSSYTLNILSEGLLVEGTIAMFNQQAYSIGRSIALRMLLLCTFIFFLMLLRYHINYSENKSCVKLKICYCSGNIAPMMTLTLILTLNYPHDP